MFGKSHHPLWTHLPAIGLLAYMIYVMAAAWPWPESTPVHFGASGRPDRMGSPWELAIGLTLISAFFIVVSSFIDEHKARYERKKTFTWVALLDEIALAHMATLVTFQFNQALDQGMNARFDFPWTVLLALLVVSVGPAAVLETLRPWKPALDFITAQDFKVEADSRLVHTIRNSGRWAYFESQNPAWISALCLVSAGGVLFGAYQMMRASLIGAALLAMGALIMALVIGGLRVFVSPEGLRVRLGILGVRLLKLRADEIAGVTVHQFSPIGDFGGWGIRRGRGMTAFFFRGNRGVRLITTGGKQYLIGSDTPERLASVLEAFKTLA